MVPALLLAAMLAQAPPDPSEADILKKQVQDLRAEVEKLKKELAATQGDAEQLEKFSKEAAEEIGRLRARIKDLEKSAAAAPATSPSPAATPTASAGPEPVPGPDKVLTGKVLDVAAKFNFITINIGEVDGVKPGYRFEIARRERDGSTRRIAVGEVEHYIGADKKYAKVKIVEGQTAEIRIDDEAVAFRRIETPKPTTGPKPVATEGPRKYVVTGINGDTFFISYGKIHGAKQGDLVFAYLNRKLRAKLRLEQVDEDWSSAKIVDGTKLGEVSIGDELSTREEKTTAIGKVRFNDARRGLMIDIGSQTHGARMGQKFEVRRNGRKLGEIAIVKLDKLFSLADSTGDLKREEIQVDDIVESVD